MKISNHINKYKGIKIHLYWIYREANIHKNQDMKVYSIPDYHFYLGPPSQTGMIRIIVYVHKDVKVKLRQDLMCSNLNSVWLEAGLARNKRILVNNLYREWRHLGDDSALSIPEQLNDWLEHLQYWEKALDSGFEVVCLGDYNLNHCNWTDT